MHLADSVIVLGKSTILPSVCFQVFGKPIGHVRGLKYFKWWGFKLILVHVLEVCISYMKGYLIDCDLDITII